MDGYTSKIWIGSPNNTKDKEILSSVIGSAGGLLVFLCACCIIISVCICQKFISKRNDNLKPRFVIYIISSILTNDVITMYVQRI